MEEEEREAVQALRQGDIRGLEALVRRYQLRAVRTAYGITGDRQAAEDAVSDAFVAVYDRIATFDERRAFAPWFFRIVVNNALKAVARTRDRLVMGDAAAHVIENRSGTAPGPEERLMAQEARSSLLRAIAQLPPEQRAVTVLRYYLEMSEREIAETLGCPTGTVKWRLFAGRNRLQRLLNLSAAEERGVAR